MVDDCQGRLYATGVSITSCVSDRRAQPADLASPSTDHHLSILGSLLHQWRHLANVVATLLLMPLDVVVNLSGVLV